MAAPLARSSPTGFPLPPGTGRARGRAWLAALLVLLLVGGAAATGYLMGEAKSVVPVWDPLWVRAYLDRPLDAAAPGSGFWVTGYWVGYDLQSLRTLQQRSPYLDQVIAFSYGFSADGSLQGHDPFIVRGVVAKSKRILLFANMTNGDFSADLSRTLLTDPAARSRSQQEIIDQTVAYGAAGAQLDFEGVPHELRSQLTSYVSDLATALHQRGLTLSMAVPAKLADSPNSAWSGAFDYAALGNALDEMYIMAYDEHYRLGPPGPIASLPWTENVIRYAISVVPTKKLVLGVPGYGYDWPPDQAASDQASSAGSAGSADGGQGAAGGGGAKTVLGRTVDSYLAQLHAIVNWDPVAGENVAVYGDANQAHTVWFPDQRSLDAKLDLAKKYNLKGVALWRLGLESSTYWQPLAAWRATPEEPAPDTSGTTPGGASTPVGSPSQGTAPPAGSETGGTAK